MLMHKCNVCDQTAGCCQVRVQVQQLDIGDISGCTVIERATERTRQVSTGAAYYTSSPHQKRAQKPPVRYLISLAFDSGLI